ncbi:hypothetical protein ACU8OT_29370 (plasmid) [Rhizobium leguminosarum]
MKSRLFLALLMSSMLAPVAAAQGVSATADILKVSSYLMPPRSTWAAIGPAATPNVVVGESAGEGELGFRVFHLREAVKGEKQAAIDLAQSGLVQTGDIFLSFRPLWDKTLAYAHMQLGVSHSALAFVVSQGDEKFIMTLESPISYSSPMNAPEHYSDLDAIHVVRPELDDQQKRHLEMWARLILTKRDRFEFFSDYSLPMYKRGLAAVSTPMDEIAFLADVALGHSPAKFESYCSEFAWSLLGLRDCDPSNFNRQCVRPVFATSNGMLTGVVPQLGGGAGLVQGAEAALAGSGLPDPDQTKALTESVFVDVLTDPSQLAGRMSSGHLQVAEANRENMKIINQYYRAGEPEAIANGLNHAVSDNVSPTSFLIRSNAGLDGLRYVGTIVFDR